MKTLLKIIITGFAAVGIIAVGITGWAIYSLSQEPEVVASPTYTGEDVLVSVNNYRHSIGVSELRVDQPLCNNIGERYLEIKQPGNGHQGFKEWAAENELADTYNGYAELYTFAENTQEVIQDFLDSPSHKMILENPKSEYICTYAADGVAIIELATSRK